MALTASKIGQLIDELSIASLRSWLKSQGFQHSANSKEEMVQRILKLHKKNAISEEQFEDAVSNLEEASGKRVMLFQVPDDKLKALSTGSFQRHLTELGAKPAAKPVRAPRLPSIRPVSMSHLKTIRFAQSGPKPKRSSNQISPRKSSSRKR